MKPGKLKTEGAEETAVATEDNPVEETETTEAETVEDNDSVKRENEELKKRLERLEERLERTPEPQAQQQNKITSAQLRNLTEAQREAISTAWGGMDFNEIVSRVEANERQDEANERLVDKARVNVRDAIDDACDADPQVSKLKSHIKEYLSDIPASDKADQKRLAHHMKKAIIYAKGAAGVSIRTTAKPRVEPSTPGPDQEAVFDKSGDDIPVGKHDLGNGFKIEIEDRMTKEQRAKYKHPEHKYGIRASIHQDEPPKFR